MVEHLNLRGERVGFLVVHRRRHFHDQTLDGIAGADTAAVVVFLVIITILTRPAFVSRLSNFDVECFGSDEGLDEHVVHAERRQRSRSVGKVVADHFEHVLLRPAVFGQFVVDIRWPIDQRFHSCTIIDKYSSRSNSLLYELQYSTIFVTI